MVFLLDSLYVILHLIALRYLVLLKEMCLHVPLSSLRRSQSLDDLSISDHPCEYYQSCPDLLEMQSLHNMHPGLHDGLHCDQLYYSIQNDSTPHREVIKRKNHHQRYEQNYLDLTRQ